MVMQTVRSRSNTSVLPYLVSDVKKLEMPPRFERSFSDLSVSGSDLTQRTRCRTSSFTKEKKLSSSVLRLPLLVSLAILACTFYLGSAFTNSFMQKHVTELEDMRDRLMDAQASLNAQLQRTMKRQEEERKLRDDPVLKEKVSILLANVEKLEQELKERQQETILAKRDIEILGQRTHRAIVDLGKESSGLRTWIQHAARAQANADFGPGPHYCQFTLNIPGHGLKAFTVQFATLEHMPVTVNNFLQQIKQKLWDDSAFYLKANHVVVARPVSWDSSRSKRADFGQTAHVPFSEYHDEFPHTAYTLGLSGNPSGPDFYVNRIDNTIPHGPRGHQKDGFAEPCFAKVIIGTETIDLLGGLPTQEEDELRLKTAVQILKVDVVSDLRNVVGGVNYLSSLQKKL